ncbi:MAG TPA: hypothetical protein VHM91_15950 [Verrucomicrobiales bacterium]|nr:hypothetical protein [Verrucomicrobiales bacterium]
MNVCPLFLRRLAGMAFLAAAFLSGTGCETSKDADKGERSLSFPMPKSMAGGAGTGKWTSLPREGGTEYVQVLGDMEDVVSFYGFSHPVAPAVKTFDDMETLMRADNSLGFRTLERGEILGIPVLWFEKEATEKGSGSETLASTLKAKPRQPGGTYLVRTRGVFMLQTGAQPKFVTIACARTSVHGQIGPVYESQFRAWLTSIVETCFL